MSNDKKKPSELLDGLYLELANIDDENLSFHNLVILENIKEQLNSLKSQAGQLSNVEQESLPPIPNNVKISCIHSIAIIDDDQDTQNLLKFYFEKNGIGITSYVSAIEALAKIEPGQFDILLVDLMMPEMTGFEFIQKIKSKIDFNKTKIIIGSAKNNQIDRMNALNLGAIDYINKPYDLSELFMIMKRNLLSDAA